MNAVLAPYFFFFLHARTGTTVTVMTVTTNFSSHSTRICRTKKTTPVRGRLIFNVIFTCYTHHNTKTLLTLLLIFTLVFRVSFLTCKDDKAKKYIYTVDELSAPHPPLVSSGGPGHSTACLRTCQMRNRPGILSCGNHRWNAQGSFFVLLLKGRGGRGLSCELRLYCLAKTRGTKKSSANRCLFVPSLPYRKFICTRRVGIGPPEGGQGVSHTLT